MTDTRMERLRNFHQEHLLRFADELSLTSLAILYRQIDDIDLEELQQLIGGKVENVDWGDLAQLASPPPAIRLEPSADGQRLVLPNSQEARRLGEACLQRGEVAMLLVAGGQGTRLGFDLPKGMFPIGPISGRSLFQMLADRLIALSRKYAADIPLYIMTSPATDSDTRDYFAAEGLCGLKPDQLSFFCQGQMPAVDATTGQILLADKGEIALSPDGHGGLVSALVESGCLDQAQSQGIKQFYYAQIDNPLAELCDPELLGHHLLAASQMTTQVVKKRFAREKVGNVVSVAGKTRIIEYSDLPDSIAERTGVDGQLQLWAGNIAIHIFDAEFLERATRLNNGLPFHRALKKVPFIDVQGSRVMPQEPNAIKFERFIFDLLPLAERALVVEAEASQVFAPVKNADGAPVDTPSHAKEAMLALHRAWLTDAGARIDDGVRVEIHPLWALDAKEVREKIPESVHFVADTFLR